MKLNDFKNMKHTDGYCPICKNQSEILYDEFHGETFCCKCGYVLRFEVNVFIVNIQNPKKFETLTSASYDVDTSDNFAGYTDIDGAQG